MTNAASTMAAPSPIPNWPLTPTNCCSDSNVKPREPIAKPCARTRRKPERTDPQEDRRAGPPREAGEQRRRSGGQQCGDRPKPPTAVQRGLQQAGGVVACGGAAQPGGGQHRVLQHVPREQREPDDADDPPCKRGVEPAAPSRRYDERRAGEHGHAVSRHARRRAVPRRALRPLWGLGVVRQSLRGRADLLLPALEQALALGARCRTSRSRSR